MTVPRQNRTARNDNQLAPGVGDLTNRYDRPVYETQIAQPRDLRDRVRRSHQEMRAQEGLGWQQEYSGAFADSVQQADTGAAHANYERIQAGQSAGRSKLGSGRLIPAWTDEQAYLSGFASGSTGDQRQGSPFPVARSLRGNPNTITDLRALEGGERPGSIVVRKNAPPNGGRGVRNDAVVTD